MDVVCNICGVVGWEETIATCAKCGNAHEHVYCMRVNTLKVPDDWVCEECVSSQDKELPVADGNEQFQCSSGARHDVRKQECSTRVCGNLLDRHSQKLKAVRTGKVRFLPAEEVVKLTSGAMKTDSPKKNFIRGSCSSPTMFSPPRKKPWPRTVVAALMKPNERDRRMQITSPTRQQAAKQSKVVPEERTNAAKEVRNVEMNVKKIVPKESYAPPVSECSPRFHRSDDKFYTFAEPKNFHLEEGDPLNILPKIRLYLPYLPALEATWKGGFNILNAVPEVKLYDGFQAQPASTVHRKAYQSSKTMPTVLQVELLPRSNTWVDLFGNDLPDFLDVALYFFPSSNVGRSNSTSLSELMEIQNSMMRGYIDGVELLIFTSKHMHADAQDVIARSSTGHFLWGVFRSAKKVKTLHEELASVVTPSECDGKSQSSQDGSHVADMEIDMIGGLEVGTGNVITTEENSKRVYTKHEKQTVEEDNTSNNKLLYVLKEVESRIQQDIESFIQAQHNISQLISKVSQRVNKDSTSPDLLETSLVKSSSSTEEEGIAPGFARPQTEEKPKPKPGNMISTTEGNTDPGDGRNIKLLKEDNAGLQRVTGNEDATLQSHSMEVQTTLHEFLSSQHDLDYLPSEMNYSLAYWSPPPPGWIKLNVVGKSKWDVGVAGAGGIIRDESGNWVVGYTLNLAKKMGLATELWAVFQGLLLAWSRGFKRVLVESESHVLVECLRKDAGLDHPCRDLINCCIHLIKRQWVCWIYYIPREANICTNYLANQFEGGPLGLTVHETPPVDMVPGLEHESMVAASVCDYQSSLQMPSPLCS